MLMTKRFDFSSPLHRTCRTMVLIGNYRQETYNMTQDDVDILHGSICGCNHEPTCELWENLEHSPKTHYIVTSKVGLSVRGASLRTHYDCECLRCGKVYQGVDWSLLPLLGHMGAFGEANHWHDLELRNCECGTTMARSVK